MASYAILERFFFSIRRRTGRLWVFRSLAIRVAFVLPPVIPLVANEPVYKFHDIA